ncbi:MAG: MFS transporter [Gammaproteobacteria bacterium]|nr:MFS transporter [Gammaproteobacteria bacterium]
MTAGCVQASYRYISHKLIGLGLFACAVTTNLARYPVKSPFLPSPRKPHLKSAAPPYELRTIASLASLYAFRMLGLFMVLPVLMLYGQEYEASTPALLGLALGAYGLSQALLQVPFGMLSDRWGRKPVIAAGLVIFAIGSIVAAESTSVYGLILGRFLQGCGAIASAIMALVTDLTSDEGRTKAMASIGASIGLSFTLALVLGPVLTAWGGLSLVFWVTAALAGVGLLILYKVVPTPYVSAQRNRDSGAVPELLLDTLGNPQLLRLNFGIFVLHFVLMASFLVLPTIMESQLGIGRQQHWQVYLPVLLLAFVAMVPLIIVSEKKRKTKPVVIGAVALLGLMELAMVWSQQDRVWFLLGLFLFFVAFNLLEATLPSLMSKLAPAGKKGTASGIYSTCQFLGAFAGGAGGGWLLAQAGVTALLGACGLLVAAWLVLVLSMTPPRYLAGVQVPLSKVDSARAYSLLAALPGVEEVVLVEKEAAAYLKVDPAVFKRDSLKAIL